MANRRMFSRNVTNSGKFLMMPHESQALYFHLCLHADDDGVVEAYTVMRLIGAMEDTIRVLVAKDFVRVLNDDMVSYIMDWNEHNLLRADRKIDSRYKNLLLQVIPEAPVVEAKPRADTHKYTGGQPLDVQRTTVGPRRLGKVSIGKDRDTTAVVVETPSASSPKKYSRKTDITTEVFTVLAEKHSIPTTGVEQCWNKLVLWCDKNGKTYKNYKAALDDWIGRSIEEGRLRPVKQDVFVEPKVEVSAHSEEHLANIRSELSQKLSL